jgi:hypothetical protein
MTTGTTLRDMGVYRVSKNTPQAWKDSGLSIIMCLVANGNEITAEDVREWVGEPPSPNAMGALFLTACRAGIVVRVGYRQAKRPERHASVLGVYTRPQTQQYND